MNFLFDPADIAARLSTLPHIRAKLRDPHHEGEPSQAFPRARKSPGQIYRVLGNANFPNLEALLKSLDFCLRHGFDQPELLKTRANTNFVASLAELQAAEHFILRRLDVGKIPSTGGSSIPDLLVRGHGLEVAVEAYCPRRWQNLSDFLEDLKEVVFSADTL